MVDGKVVNLGLWYVEEARAFYAAKRFSSYDQLVFFNWFN